MLISPVENRPGRVGWMEKPYQISRNRKAFIRVKEVPNVEKLSAIKGIGLGIVIGFVAEVDDI